MSGPIHNWTVVDLPMGARIKVGRPNVVFGNGLTMLLEMRDPADTRQAEVMLDPDSLNALIQTLESFKAKPNG